MTIKDWEVTLDRAEQAASASRSAALAILRNSLWSSSPPGFGLCQTIATPAFPGISRLHPLKKASCFGLVGAGKSFCVNQPILFELRLDRNSWGRPLMMT